MTKLASQEGWLLIDHRASPGTPEVPEGKMFETASYTCKHCNYVVIKNKLRTRERSVCLKCMAIICDSCASIGVCQPFEASFIDRPDLIISTPGYAARTTPSFYIQNRILTGGGST